VPSFRTRRRLKIAAIFVGGLGLTFAAGMAFSDRLGLGTKPDVQTCNNLAPNCHHEEINSNIFASNPRSSIDRARRLIAANATHPGSIGFTCSVASITDGDTLRCADGTRVRIAGINAREHDGSCNIGAPCPDASPQAATAALSALASGQVLQCEPNGRTYNRIAAFCRTSGGVDVSCAILSSDTVAQWDRHWGSHTC
jgi:hypothetical protein